MHLRDQFDPCEMTFHGQRCQRQLPTAKLLGVDFGLCVCILAAPLNTDLSYLLMMNAADL
jgi:hypothetical protein